MKVKFEDVEVDDDLGLVSTEMKTTWVAWQTDSQEALMADPSKQK